jgi:hypothetical protein
MVLSSSIVLPLFPSLCAVKGVHFSFPVWLWRHGFRHLAHERLVFSFGITGVVLFQVLWAV